MQTKIFLWAFILTIFSSCCSREAIRTLNITVNYTDAYCGGAAPSEEMLAELQKEKPFTGTLYLYQDPEFHGDGIPTDVVDGVAKFKCLPKGPYFASRFKSVSIEDAEKAKIDPMCKQQQMMIESAHFQVVDDMKDAAIVLHYACDPCAPPVP